ncbi:hypothetical protein NC652_000004 [Populus alba x Populus x berolinensis]|nr:hypothetical protein NC652_000004 [Populus alba x Populus x berolinensis]
MGIVGPQVFQKDSPHPPSLPPVSHCQALGWKGLPMSKDHLYRAFNKDFGWLFLLALIRAVPSFANFYFLVAAGLSHTAFAPVSPWKRPVFPIRFALLSANYDEGVSYVETMNLDGETNLKLRDRWRNPDNDSLYDPNQPSKSGLAHLVIVTRVQNFSNCWNLQQKDRMSVAACNEDVQILPICKGADRFIKNGRMNETTTAKHLNLTTENWIAYIGTAYKKLDESEYSARNNEFVKAKTSISADRVTML